MFFRKRERLNLVWNRELFEGMNYHQIKAFKKKTKKIVAKLYKLEKEKEKLENQLFSARKQVMGIAKEKRTAKNNKIFKFAVLGTLVVTMYSAGAGLKTDNTVATDMQPTVYEIDMVDIKLNSESPSATVQEIVDVVMGENVTTEETANEYTDNTAYSYVESAESVDVNIIESATLESSSLDLVDTEMFEVENTPENIEIVETIEIEEINEEENPQNIIIFDKAIEKIMNRCEESFQEFYTSEYVPIMGTYILPHYNDMAAYKVAGWFEAYFGSQALTYNLKYNAAFNVNPTGVEFRNTEDGFKLYINKDAVSLSVNLDLEDAKNASISGGVSQEMRDYLTSEECQAFLPSFDKMMEANHLNIKNKLSESNELFEFVKNSVENELKTLSSYDIEVVFN